MADVLRFPLSSGVREDSDEKGLPPGTLLSGVNVRQDKAGRVRKRRGVMALATASVYQPYQLDPVEGTISAGVRLVSRTGRDLGLHDGTHVWEYGETLETWRRVERVSPWSATWDLFDASFDSVENAESAVIGDMLCAVWRVGLSSVSGYVCVRIVDRSTGAVLLPTTSLGSGVLPKVLAHQGKFVIVWSKTTTREGVTIDPADLTVPAVSTTIISGCVSDDVFGVCSDGNWIYLVTELSAGANRTAVRQINAFLSVVGSLDTDGNGATTTSFWHVHCEAVAGESLWVTICRGSGLGAPAADLQRIDPSTMTVTVAPVTISANSTINAWVKRISATRLVVAYTSRTTLSPNHTWVESVERSATTLLPTTVANPSRTSYNAELASAPWLAGGRLFCAANTSHKTGFLSRLTSKRKVVIEVEYDDTTGWSGVPHRVMGVLDTASGGVNGTLGAQYLPSFAVVDDDEAFLLTPTLEEAPYSTEIRRQALTLVHLERGTPKPSTLGRTAFLPGAAPAFDDGANVLPAGFVDSPTVETISASAIGGSMQTGTYQYVFWYEWIDSAGMKHRSVPSASSSIAVTGPTGSVSIDVGTTSLGSKFFVSDSVFQPVPTLEIVVARTKADGSTYYRLSKEPDGLYVANITTARNVTISDVYADTDIDPTGATLPLAVQPQIYTEGGVLDAVAPPSLLCAHLHAQRIYGIAGDRRTLLASTSMAEDPRVAPYFNEALSLWFDEDKVATASLDARLVVFAADGIDLVDGDGPDVTGNARDWRVARLQTDVGCTNADSVVAFPGGVFFESAKGLMVLSRSLEVSWVGRAVRDSLESFPVITSSALVAEEHEVRFTCTTEDGTSGLVLVFDYEHAAWYTRTYAKAFVDSLVVGGVWHALAADGTVYRESSSTSLDDASYVESEVEFVALSQALAGWSRLKAVDLIGTSLSNHDLEVSLARDFDTDYEQTKTFSAEDDVTTTGPLEWARVHPATQKAKGFRVRVRDLTPTSGALGTGEGLMLDGIAVHIQTKRGPGPVSAGRRG